MAIDLEKLKNLLDTYPENTILLYGWVQNKEALYVLHGEKPELRDPTPYNRFTFVDKSHLPTIIAHNQLWGVVVGNESAHLSGGSPSGGTTKHYGPSMTFFDIRC